MHTGEFTKEEEKTEYERVLLVQAFSALLTAYPFHPVLWVLYSVCRDFRKFKRDWGAEDVEILDYWHDKHPWLKGQLGSVRDVLAIDDCADFWVYATIRSWGKAHLYIIPREWLSRVYVNKRGNFVHSSFVVGKYCEDPTQVLCNVSLTPYTPNSTKTSITFILVVVIVHWATMIIIYPQSSAFMLVLDNSWILCVCMILRTYHLCCIV